MVAIIMGSMLLVLQLAAALWLLYARDWTFFVSSLRGVMYDLLSLAAFFVVGIIGIVLIIIGVMQSRKEKPVKRFTSKRLAIMAVFVSMSYAVSFLEIPMPLFGANFLKLDFGNVFIVLISFLLGPMEGVFVCLLKEGLRCFNSSSLCAGELANFIITSSYLLFPSILYQYRKTLKTVIFSLVMASFIATGVALVANRFLIFPTFAALLGGKIYGMTVLEAFAKWWISILIFNLIKTVLIGVMTMLLYKRLSNFLKKMKI